MFSVALKVECGKYAELEHASTPQGLWGAWGMTIGFGRRRDCGVEVRRSRSWTTAEAQACFVIEQT